ncbi:MAG: hypothetical protein MJZ34_02955 [Paludibacteraceae bacterium]|nr:hypothetical protein [Paludibacteraceae bacterium]
MSSTLQINLNLTEDGKWALRDSSTIEVKAMYLVNVKYTEEPTALPSADQCLKDENPSGSAGSYLGYFNNNTDTDFTGKSLLVTLMNGENEEIFSWGTFNDDFVIERNAARYIQYSYNLTSDGKEVWFNNHTTYAIFAAKIGTTSSPSSVGSSSTPIYLENGDFRECSINSPSQADSSQMDYNNPSSEYVLVTPAQIKAMIDAAIQKHITDMHQ